MTMLQALNQQSACIYGPAKESLCTGVQNTMFVTFDIHKYLNFSINMIVCTHRYYIFYSLQIILLVSTQFFKRMKKITHNIQEDEKSFIYKNTDHRE